MFEFVIFFKRTRMKIFQKACRVFQYPHSIVAMCYTRIDFVAEWL